jgi:hypothetical protein
LAQRQEAYYLGAIALVARKTAKHAQGIPKNCRFL